MITKHEKKPSLSLSIDRTFAPQNANGRDCEWVCDFSKETIHDALSPLEKSAEERFLHVDYGNKSHNSFA